MNDELATIEDAAAMRRFYDAIQERAKSLPPNVAEHTKPHVCAKALWMLAQGAPYREIRRVTQLGHETIRRLEWDHNATLESKRKEFSIRYAMAAQECTDLIFAKAEQLADDPDALKNTQIDKLALAVGIMSDQSAKLAGLADANVEKKAGLSIEDARALIEAARQRVATKGSAQVVDAEIVANDA